MAKEGVEIQGICRSVLISRGGAVVAREKRAFLSHKRMSYP